MSCELCRTHLHAYLDGELDAPAAAAFEQHLASCQECTSALANEQALRESFARSNLYERAPAGLRQKIRASLPPVTPEPARRAIPWRWPVLAAASLLFAFLGWQLFSGAFHRPAQYAFANAILDAHLRSLQPGHLTDVESTDQHTVKPWFDGKIDFAPPVRDFAAAGFPLAGGRIDVVDGQTVAVLVYGRRKHFVNVFVWKATDTKPWAGSGTAQGYHWLAWERDGLHFCAISDAAPADLEQLKQFFQSE